MSTDAKQCVEKAWFRPVMAVLPAWLRLAQCLRRYRDTREAYPHLANAFKYSTVIVVIIFASLATHYAGGSLEGDPLKRIEVISNLKGIFETHLKWIRRL